MVGSGFAISLLAWSLLSLGLPRHQRTVLQRELPPARARALRAGGWLLLGVSLALFVVTRGWAQGPIFWTCVLMLAAIAWVLLLTLLPRQSWMAAVAIAVATGIGALL